MCNMHAFVGTQICSFRRTCGIRVYIARWSVPLVFVPVHVFPVTFLSTLECFWDERYMYPFQFEFVYFFTSAVFWALIERNISSLFVMIITWLPNGSICSIFNTRKVCLFFDKWKTKEVTLLRMIKLPLGSVETKII